MKLSVAGVANLAKKTHKEICLELITTLVHIFFFGGGGVPMVSIGTVVSLPYPLLLAVFSQGKAIKVRGAHRIYIN